MNSYGFIRRIGFGIIGRFGDGLGGEDDFEINENWIQRYWREERDRVILKEKIKFRILIDSVKLYKNFNKIFICIKIYTYFSLIKLLNIYRKM